MPENTPAALNAFIINISLPAITFLYLHDMTIDPALLAPATMPWLFFGTAYLILRILGKKLMWTQATIGCLLLTAGFGNTSFVGLPMIEAYYGKQALGIGLVADQAGSFMVLSTLGLVTAARFSSSELSLRTIGRRVLFFPPFLAAVIALLLRPLDYPDALRSVLSRLGETLTPIALISVGMQLRLSSLNDSLRELSIGLLMKLIVLPALMLVFYAYVFRAEGLTLQVTLFEAAMPPMITGSIIAMEHKLNQKLAALMVGIGIPLSFLTLAGWWWLLRAFDV